MNETAMYPSHDYLPSMIFLAGIAFLVGFKISAWMSKRQIERLKKAWGRWP